MIVNQYFMVLTRRGYDFDDLVQEGLYAILRAEPHYNPKRGAETTYYARAVYNWIGGRIAKPQANAGCIPQERMVSLDRTITRDGPEPMANLLPDITSTDPFDAVFERIMLDGALKRLDDAHPKEAVVIRQHYLGDKQMCDIAAERGCSRQRISVLAADGLRRLRWYMGMTEGGQSA